MSVSVDHGWRVVHAFCSIVEFRGAFANMLIRRFHLVWHHKKRCACTTVCMRYYRTPASLCLCECQMGRLRQGTAPAIYRPVYITCGHVFTAYDGGQDAVAPSIDGAGHQTGCMQSAPNMQYVTS